MSHSEANNSHMHPRSGANNELLPVTIRLLALCLAFLIYAGLATDLLDNNQGLVAYTLLMCGYIFIEIKNLSKNDPRLTWFNPVALASAFSFVMAYGVTNILYFMPQSLLRIVGLEPIATPWMNQLMLLVMLGAVSMWAGYSSNIARRIGLAMQRSRALRRSMSTTLVIRQPVLYTFIAISLIAKLWAIRLGVFGYSSTYERLIEAANYTQYFALADSLGKLALVAVALKCFAKQGAPRSDWKLLLIILTYEIAFGFISGMKSAVIMPLIIAGFIYYIQKQRLPTWLIPAVTVGIMAAYMVIEPFRLAHTQSGSADTSLGSIVSTMVEASSETAANNDQGNSTALQILARVNMTWAASLGIEYAENHKRLPTDSPEFLNDIISAPINAVIPRFLWESKPLQNIGLWYTNQVFGVPSFSSTAMGPFTYLNFAGGPLAVILGFLFVGILQRAMFDGFSHFGGGGALVMIGLLSTLVDIDSAFNSLIINIIRLTPILIFVQYLLLRPTRAAQPPH